ncbi:hypothetical protein tb265_49650 [Gemmatimonadetes bacterium T265]|nr:hypothetical protein tb265_49650 [Gemmatimonadetes bacterium T265]
MTAPAAPTTTEAERAAALGALGASPAVIEELLAYGVPPVADEAFGAFPPLPLPDEPCVAAWDRYVTAAAREGAFATLQRRLVQLRFPIAAGMSETPAYLAATRRGDAADAAPGLALAAPESVRLFVHPTAAGRVPVIVAGTRTDFVRLLQALTRRNEPAPIPESMGACIVGGYNNWDRVRALRATWAADRPPAERTDAAWEATFRTLVPRRELYQDRFILLSDGPYSATPGEAFGTAPDAWRRVSAVIRLEHECAHYFTKRVFGTMRNTLVDELAADYAGIVAAVGEFRSSWFLRFMGLEHARGYRAGGRLENYRGDPPLSDEAFAMLQTLVRRAAMQLERFDAGARAAAAPPETPRVIAGIARLGLELLAGDDGARRLADVV